jgi:hypothetical protein
MQTPNPVFVFAAIGKYHGLEQLLTKHKFQYLRDYLVSIL